MSTNLDLPLPKTFLAASLRLEPKILPKKGLFLTIIRTLFASDPLRGISDPLRALSMKNCGPANTHLGPGPRAPNTNNREIINQFYRAAYILTPDVANTERGRVPAPPGKAAVQRRAPRCEKFATRPLSLAPLPPPSPRSFGASRAELRDYFTRRVVVKLC